MNNRFPGQIEFIQNNEAWGTFTRGDLAGRSFDFPEHIPVENGETFSPAIGDGVMFISESGPDFDSYIIFKANKACILHVDEDNSIIDAITVNKLSS